MLVVKFAAATIYIYTVTMKSFLLLAFEIVVATIFFYLAVSLVKEMKKKKEGGDILRPALTGQGLKKHPSGIAK
jgi:hypothetical protein